MVDVASATFWNTSFVECRNITFEEKKGIARVEEPILINLTGLTGKNANSSDLRIINKPCNDNTGIEIPYDLFSNTSNSASILFFANSSALTNNTWSVYFNLSTASFPAYADEITNSSGWSSTARTYINGTWIEPTGVPFKWGWEMGSTATNGFHVGLWRLNVSGIVYPNSYQEYYGWLYGTLNTRANVPQTVTDRNLSFYINITDLKADVKSWNVLFFSRQRCFLNWIELNSTRTDVPAYEFWNAGTILRNSNATAGWWSENITGAIQNKSYIVPLYSSNNTNQNNITTTLYQSNNNGGWAFLSNQGNYTFLFCHEDREIGNVLGLMTNTSLIWRSTTALYGNLLNSSLSLATTEYQNTANPCACPTTPANWNVDMSLNCTLNADCQMSGYNITFNGTGNFTVNATLNLSNFLNLTSGMTVFVKLNGVCNVK